MINTRTFVDLNIQGSAGTREKGDSQKPHWFDCEAKNLPSGKTPSVESRVESYTRQAKWSLNSSFTSFASVPVREKNSVEHEIQMI